jgi:hypothetical protein
MKHLLAFPMSFKVYAFALCYVRYVNLNQTQELSSFLCIFYAEELHNLNEDSVRSRSQLSVNFEFSNWTKNEHFRGRFVQFRACRLFREILALPGF